LIRGPQVTPGYFRNPEITSRSLVGGWLHTGDFGHVDADGRLWVAGRRGDLIITGGEKVVPDEVEAVLTAHPQVVGAAVFGQDDAIWGQRVAAAVVLEAGAELDASRLQGWCRRFLASFKVPRHFEVVAALPRTASSKLRRYRLRERATGDETGHN
jgi:fatty-acyl-CoA synthase